MHLKPPIVITPEYGLAAGNTLPPPVVIGTNTLCAAAYILVNQVIKQVPLVVVPGPIVCDPTLPPGYPLL